MSEIREVLDEIRSKANLIRSTRKTHKPSRHSLLKHSPRESYVNSLPQIDSIEMPSSEELQIIEKVPVCLVLIESIPKHLREKL